MNTYLIFSTIGYGHITQKVFVAETAEIALKHFAVAYPARTVQYIRQA